MSLRHHLAANIGTDHRLFANPVLLRCLRQVNMQLEAGSSRIDMGQGHGVGWEGLRVVAPGLCLCWVLLSCHLVPMLQYVHVLSTHIHTWLNFSDMFCVACSHTAQSGVLASLVSLLCHNKLHPTPRFGSSTGRSVFQRFGGSLWALGLPARSVQLHEPRLGGRTRGALW